MPVAPFCIAADASIWYLRSCVEHAKRSGFMAGAIDRAGITARIGPLAPMLDAGMATR
jgi:hypothetical protein